MRARSRIGRARGAGVAFGLLVAAGLVLLGGAAPVRAATPDLTLVVAATYDVDPPAGRVAVTARITATNHLHDTATTRYFFQTGYLAVLPGTSAFKITAPGVKPAVSVASKTSAYTLLKLSFGTQLAAGKSLVLTLHFDIRDPGGAPDRAVRISPSIVSFSAWAFATADTPGSTVTVRLPAGYTTVIGRGPLSGPTTDTSGRAVWSSGRLATPLTFIADISADRPSDYATRALTTTIGTTTAEVSLRSWPDDTAWRDRVGDLVVRGLPVLGREIGLDWPISGPLIVQEALVRSTGGYAGLFDPSARRIQISYVASSGVVLHEAAHAWFNGGLVTDRWAAEAFASLYAADAAKDLEVKITSPVLTPALEAKAFPLNAWGPLGSGSSDTEAYGYAASLAFAHAVADRAGADALRRVWAAAASGVGAYQPASGGELASSPPDWRGLLDLLEDTTGKPFDDLWRQWIARPSDMPLLDARLAARTTYARAVAAAGPWTLPRSIRDEMRAWQFDAAARELVGVEAVIEQRGRLREAAASAGLTLPPTLESDFEGSAGLPAAAAEAAAELSTIEAIRQAAETRPDGSAGKATVLTTIGLLGSDPAASLAHAQTAFAAGELDRAIGDASEAASTWTGAASLGQARIVSAGLLALAVLLLGRMFRLRGRRASESEAAAEA